MCRALCLLLLLLCLPRAAWAEARVLVLSPVEERPRPTLVDALRLQLQGTARVELRQTLLPAMPAASRVALAAEVVSARHVDFALWLESVTLGDGTRVFALYVVGDRAGRAVMDVARLPAQADTPDVDRTLALKASEIIEASLESAAPLLKARSAAGAVRAQAPPAFSSSESAPRLGVELGAALSAASTSNTRAGTGLGLSWLLVSAPLELDARLLGQLWSDSVATRAGLRVRASDALFGIGFAARQAGTLQLGIKLGLGAHLLHARGFEGETSTGSASELVPSLSAGPELRLKLGSRVRFAADVSAEWLAVRQTFKVSGVVVEDLGRFRAGAQLSLIFLVL